MPESLFGQLVAFLVTVVSQFGHLLVAVAQTVLPLLPVVLWCAWWLWGVNWRKAWPVLGQGGWVPVVLIALVVALTWAHVSPVSCDCLGFVRIPPFWWHLGAVSALVTAALFCGWLQGVLGWAPAEVNLEPPATPAHGHGHGHGGHH